MDHGSDGPYRRRPRSHLRALGPLGPLGKTDSKQATILLESGLPVTQHHSCKAPLIAPGVSDRIRAKRTTPSNVNQIASTNRIPPTTNNK